jgi:3-hydroxyisobutyrate dehydrogenase
LLARAPGRPGFDTARAALLACKRLRPRSWAAGQRRQAPAPKEEPWQEPRAMASEEQTVGWVGAGRMGVALASRVLRAGYDVSVWNRTRAKAEPLAERGARIVESPVDLGGCDVVVTMVSSDEVLESVTLGEKGALTGERAPRFLVDSSTVSAEASERVRVEAAKRGCTLLAAPVSGNPKSATTGWLTVVASGPEDAFEALRPLLETFGRHVTYVGEGDAARLVKICHNLMLGVTAQMLAETTLLAEASGVSRAAYLEFFNASVMGSVFTRYKAPAYVRLDYRPTFTSHLLRKDFELGLAAARELNVPLPVSALTHQLVMELSNSEHADLDFATLIEQLARAAGRRLEPEDVPVPDGLEPLDDLGTDSP